MATDKKIVLAFDVYGTLLSTESIAKQLASHFGEAKAATVAQEWRKYQLEYTWRLNSMQKYEPFSNVTRKSLLHALAEANVSLPSDFISNLMTSYNTLHTFPDVTPLLSTLQSQQNANNNNIIIHPVLFSNGTHSMISTSLTQSPDLSPHAHLFKQIVTVEPVRKFKPDPESYRHLLREVGKEGKGEEGDVWLVSGNPFDVVGARAVGLRACWVDRGGGGWVDRLGTGLGSEQGDVGPTVVVRGVGEVVESVREYLGQEQS